MTTAPHATSAKDVVAEYLKSKAEADKPAEQRAAVTDATREIVTELPDGFTEKDVRVCVAAYASSLHVLDDFTPSRRNRAVTKTLNELVADGHLSLDGDAYTHGRPIS